MNEQFLAFAEISSETADGKHTYTLSFSETPDVVWGENWNYTPAGAVSSLKPDESIITSKAEFSTETRFLLAIENCCFAMQDCIDDIIPLLFYESGTTPPLVLHFGETESSVREKITASGLVLSELISTNKDDAVINNMIENLKDDKSGEL